MQPRPDLRSLVGAAAIATAVGACNAILGNHGADVVDLTDSAAQCRPRACDVLACGPSEDGCGGTIDCGACVRADYSCQGGGTCACETRQCEGRCGFQPDGCEGEGLDCGECKGDGLSCGGGTAGPDYCGAGVTCVPRTCNDTAGVVRCGRIAPGCGQPLVECGACPVGQTCGGAGVANVCGCEARSCNQLAVACGPAVDPACPGAPPQDCGGCPEGQSCSAAGQCVVGCAPASVDCTEKCGPVEVGCGKTPVQCGACTQGDCIANRCVVSACVPEDAAVTCSGAECGPRTDNCGNAVDCGSCAVGACTKGSCGCTPNVPLAVTGCQPQGPGTQTTCCGMGQVCGARGCCFLASDDGCGGGSTMVLP